jgi:hypothetical protein
MHSKTVAAVLALFLASAIAVVTGSYCHQANAQATSLDISNSPFGLSAESLVLGEAAQGHADEYIVLFDETAPRQLRTSFASEAHSAQLYF